jgi:hypothetical protein
MTHASGGGGTMTAAEVATVAAAPTPDPFVRVRGAREHNLRDVDVDVSADWVIDLGPGGGDAGGRIVAVGPPADVARTEGSRTAPYLAARLARARPGPYRGGERGTASRTIRCPNSGQCCPGFGHG